MNKILNTLTNEYINNLSNKNKSFFKCINNLFSKNSSFFDYINNSLDRNNSFAEYIKSLWNENNYFVDENGSFVERIKMLAKFDLPKFHTRVSFLHALETLKNQNVLMFSGDIEMENCC